MTNTPSAPSARHALIIGIEDYPGFPGQGLPAGRLDALAYWKVCRRLGYAPENIHVLTSPALEKKDFDLAEMNLALEQYLDGESHLRAHLDARLGGRLTEVVSKLKDERRDQYAGPEGRRAAQRIPQLYKDVVKEHVVASWISPDRESARWEASKENIEREIAWLQQKLALPGAEGFLAYSGHGMKLGDDLALCPSDAAPPHDRVIPFEALRRHLGALENLTVVLDCCFAAAHERRAAAPVSTLSQDAIAPAAGAFTSLGGCTFCACGPGEQAHQAQLGGYWQGAFTWAFTVALQQWAIDNRDRDARVTVSHLEILFRTRMLLQALSFPQHPMLLGQVGVGNLAVFSRDPAARTTPAPSGRRVEGQLQPDMRYTLSLGTMVLAEVYALGSQTRQAINDQYQQTKKAGGDLSTTIACKWHIDGYTDEKAMEFWYVDATALSALSTASSINFAVTPSAFSNMTAFSPPAGNPVLSEVGATVPWDRGLPDPQAGVDPSTRLNQTFVNTPYCLELSLDTGRTTVTGARWYKHTADTALLVASDMNGSWARMTSSPMGEWYMRPSW